MTPISHVILWTNGMVAVFDTQGQQMAEYHGYYGEVKDKILATYSGMWLLAEWQNGVLATFHPEQIVSHLP